ncbi:hypothetical protein BDF21DRAFT_492930 [Thamnidium elegans]|nr:hypothetical protein BDF21DRAFT_492930 [Thamnidium elegans]
MFLMENTHWGHGVLSKGPRWTPIGIVRIGCPVVRKSLYRAISYLRYGDENRYKDIKKDMLVALDANKDAYSRFFDFDTVNLEEYIKAGLDAKCNTSLVWFKTSECAQIVADAYDLPVCIYNEPSFTSFADEPFTYLPLKAPVKLKVKVQPFILQNSLNVHWHAVKLDNLQFNNLEYFWPVSKT